MTVLAGFLLALTCGIVAVTCAILAPVLGALLLTLVFQRLLPLVLVLWLLLHGRTNGRGWDRLTGVRYAHRGLHGPSVPENSLPAFRRAVERGLGAELDVHLTRDGRLAVVHDSSLARVCGADAAVEDQTAETLAAFRLEGTDEPIPFLEEVLPLFQGKTPLIVELKPTGGNWAPLAAKTMECLDRFHTDYCVESFDPRVLLWLRRHRPEVLRGQLAQNFWKRSAGQSLWVRFALTNLLCNVRTRPDFVAYRYEDRKNPALWLCRWFGMRLAYWTLSTPETLAAAERAGAMPIVENFDPEEDAIP